MLVLQSRTKRICVIVVLTAVVLTYVAHSNGLYSKPLRRWTGLSRTQSQCTSLWSPSSRREPAPRFRDYLRNDTSYITGWSGAGFTNQFMDYVNMIYLGIISDRVPIIPPFAPGPHISLSAGIIPFGDIFDLEGLRNELRSEILEWRDAKILPNPQSDDQFSTSEIEHVGCWTTVPESSKGAKWSDNVVRHLGLDASYTRVPTFTRPSPQDPNEYHVILPQLAALIYPRGPIARPESFELLEASRMGKRLKPDSYLSCFDSLYYSTSGARHFEWNFSWSPVWRTVGRHLQFTERMKTLGQSYLSRIFGVPAAKVPPFIIIHVRRGDFSGKCSKNGQKDCFPSLVAYEKHVQDIRGKLAEKSGLVVDNVVVISDEKSDAFWNTVRAKGWLFVNHTEEHTLERYGEWYPPLIDIVMQSFAVGFVGTKDSTFSLVGERRVQDWNGGLVADVNVRDGA
ncbi:hypothetical protein CPC08DRAFT_694164 [Agrocybe pediades]|nr:hypothetical protein CPC08DRAFT_694164 [Agrocybe pediades]